MLALKILLHRLPQVGGAVLRVEHLRVEAAVGYSADGAGDVWRQCYEHFFSSSALVFRQMAMSVLQDLFTAVTNSADEVHTDNALPPSVLSGRVSHSSSEDTKVPWSKKSQMVWI